MALPLVRSACLGLALAGAALAQEPGRLPDSLEPRMTNQQLADEIARALRNHPHLRHYNIHIDVRAGQVELSGHLADATQHADVLRLTRAITGVVTVSDRLEVRSAVVQTQSPPVSPLPFLTQAPKKDWVPPPPNTAAPANPPATTPVTPPPVSAPLSLNGMPQEPTPIYQGNPAYPDPQTQPPPLPPYAWPTTAPYNNWSRIAYPEVYKYDQFPFIGPFYPYPKVPPGWRSVKLTWEDGYWWFGREPSGHDWWRIRYY